MVRRGVGSGAPGSCPTISGACMHVVCLHVPLLWRSCGEEIVVGRSVPSSLVRPSRPSLVHDSWSRRTPSGSGLWAGTTSSPLHLPQ